MKEFQASRLSDGNKVMPNTIKIDDFGVTLKIPGVFSGKEKTLTYHQISSVQIDSPMVGFSTITFDTIGWDRIIAKGFSKEDAQEVKRLCQLGIQGARSGGGGHHGGGGGSNLAEVLAASEAAKAQAEVEKQKIELEQQRLRDEKEAKEAAERKERGAKFREEGKPLTAFLVETNPIWLLAGAMVYGFLFMIKMRGVEGILLKGGIATVGVAFLAFVIKDFAKLKGGAAMATIIGLLLIPIGITSWKAYDKSNHGSADVEKMLAEQNALLQSMESNTNNSTTETKENAEVKNEDKKETEEQPVNNSDQQILVGNLTNSLKGEWKGDFGGKELLISLNEVDLDLGITGYDEVKGNKRDLKGEITDNGNNNFTINLKEPGDDKWDGSFKIKYVDGENTMTGTWTANNGKSTKNFTLTKK